MSQPTPPNGDRAAANFLKLLLAGDACFVLLHGLNYRTDYVANPRLSIDLDGGYPELYQYVKEAWVVIMLVTLAVRTRVVGYLGWAVLFCYALCDDCLSLHERYGLRLAESLGFESRLGLRPEDFGELAVTAAAGGVALVVVAAAYLFGGPGFRRVSRHLAGLVAALAFFGVVVDMVHVVFMHNRVANFVLATLEDGGEMVVMSLVAGYLFRLELTGGAGSPTGNNSEAESG